MLLCFADNTPELWREEGVRCPLKLVGVTHHSLLRSCFLSLAKRSSRALPLSSLLPFSPSQLGGEKGGKRGKIVPIGDFI